MKQEEIIKNIYDLSAQTCNEYITDTQKTRDGAKLAYPKTWQKFCSLGAVMFAVSTTAGLGNFQDKEDCRKVLKEMVDIALDTVDYDKLTEQTEK